MTLIISIIIIIITCVHLQGETWITKSMHGIWYGSCLTSDKASCMARTAMHDFSPLSPYLPCTTLSTFLIIYPVHLQSLVTSHSCTLSPTKTSGCKRSWTRVKTGRECWSLRDRRRYDMNLESVRKLSTSGLLANHKSTSVKHKHRLFPTACSSTLITEALPGSWLDRHMRTCSP
jgi:hypothetical protein